VFPDLKFCNFCWEKNTRYFVKQIHTQVEQMVGYTLVFFRIFPKFKFWIFWILQKRAPGSSCSKMTLSAYNGSHPPIFNDSNSACRRPLPNHLPPSAASMIQLHGKALNNIYRSSDWFIRCTIESQHPFIFDPLRKPGGDTCEGNREQDNHMDGYVGCFAGIGLGCLGRVW
jgi:hypothetical protein